MSTHATLESVELIVAPGGEQTCQWTVRNNSDIVEAYQLDVLGDAAAWTAVEPDGLSLYPGAEATVTLRFVPPRSPEVLAGAVPFAVRAVPSERPENMVASEGVVHVQPFLDTTAEIIPRISKGQRRARHELAVDNRGNVPVTAAISGADPDGLLVIASRPADVVVPPGQAMFATIAVRNRRRLWHGPPVTHPFQVVVQGEDEAPIALDAGTVQTPVFPRSLTKIAAAAAALLLLLVAGWFLLLKPAVNSAAQSAVNKPLTQVADKANAAQSQAAAAQSQAATAQQAANTGANAAAAQPSPTPTAATKTSPAQIRLQVALNAGTTPSTSSFTVPAKTTLVMTDIVLENPQGDTGRVDVVVDTTTILTLSLANFRDLDYHFVSPVEVPAGKKLSITTTCQAPGPTLVGTSGNQCREWMLATGVNRTTS